MNCTHGGEPMNIALGDRCPWCRKIVAERTAVPAHIAANPVTPTPRATAAAPETTLPLVSGAPIARNSDPAAAHDAAARAAHDYTFDQWLVLAAHVASVDLNGDELGAVCGRPYQSVGPRRPALERNGLIEETGTRRKGKGCYRATDAGRAAWRDCPESIRFAARASLTNTAVIALDAAERGRLTLWAAS